MDKNNPEQEDKMTQQLEDILRLAEQGQTVSDAELEKLMTDPEAMERCRELAHAYSALLAESPSVLPDVDREWEKWNRHRLVARRRKRWMWGMSAGIAALLALCFLLAGQLFTSRKASTELVAVFQADKRPQQITLQLESGRVIPLNKSQIPSQAVSGAELKDDKLDYHRTVTASTSEVRMHTLSTPRGEDFKVVLSDGTEVWLNAESRLEYPSAFMGNERVVKLRGEAYFKVARDEQHPFIVQTDNMRTRVLGTEFNVRNYSVSDSHVTLIQGSVEVNGSRDGKYTRITPGEDACLQPDGDFAVRKVDVDAYIYWRDGYFYYDNVTLLDVMQSLGRWYNVTILFQNKSAMNHRLHFVADRKAGLEHAVQLLNRLKKAKIECNNDTLIVR